MGIREKKIQDGSFAGFTEREKRFIEAIFKDPTDELKAVRSAGYSKNHTWLMVKKFRENSRVQAKLSEMRSLSSLNGDTSREDVLYRYNAIVTIPITQIITWDRKGDYKVKGANELTPEQALTIKKVSITYVRHGDDKIPIVHIEQYDKLDGLAAIRDMQGFDAPKRQDIRSQSESYERDKHGSRDDLVDFILAGINSEGIRHGTVDIKGSPDAMLPGKASGVEEGS